MLVKREGERIGHASGRGKCAAEELSRVSGTERDGAGQRPGLCEGSEGRHPKMETSGQR